MEDTGKTFEFIPVLIKCSVDVSEGFFAITVCNFLAEMDATGNREAELVG